MVFESKVLNNMKRSKIAILICSNVIGGHEYQSCALVRDLKEFFDITVYVNNFDHRKLFLPLGVKVVSCSGKLLQVGRLPNHMFNGFRSRSELRKIIYGHDEIIICAGAVEAGVTVSIALHGTAPLNLYLPFFYDRVLVWGKIGYIYNAILAGLCHLYKRIITINKIQAKVINSFTGIKTVVIPNSIRPIPVASSLRDGKLLFIGRLDRQKRVDELLHWIDFSDNPFREIMIIGDGPERRKLEKIATTLRYVKVNFTGWLSAEDQDNIIDRNDILILNSLVEGEPLVLRESNLRGIRATVRDIIGIRGVTKRYQRFNSMFSLQQILISQKISQDNPIAPWPHQSEKATRLHLLEMFVHSMGGYLDD